MRITILNRTSSAFSMVEVLVIMAVLAGLAALLLSALARSDRDRRTINCVSNLRSVGHVFRIWSSDHGNRFPWAISTKEGGTLEYADTSDVFRHYLAVSNELSSPKILNCNSDIRTKASCWEQVTNNAEGLSYFVALDGDESRPQMILSGERNLMTNGCVASGVVAITSKTMLGSAPFLHKNAIVVGLTDGSAQILRGRELQKLSSVQFSSITNQSVRLAIP